MSYDEELWRDALNGDELPRVPEELDRRVLGLTRKVIACRRRGRRAIQGLVLILVFSAGWLTRGGDRSEADSATQEIPQTAPESQSAPKFEAEELMAAAEQAGGDRRADLLRRAGDDYLAREDFAAAARCYRLHLELDQNREVGVSDSWLLASIKVAN